MDVFGVRPEGAKALLSKVLQLLRFDKNLKRYKHKVV
jgi:hypothetical protein